MANKLVMLIVISALILGVIIGAGMVTRLDAQQAHELYISINQSVSASSAPVSFWKALLQEFRSFLLLFVCGLTVIGSPVAVLYIGAKGYAIGFTVGFLVKYYGLTGFLASLTGVLPHYIILIPAFMCMGIVAINFSNRLLLAQKGLKGSVGNYFMKAVLIAAAVLLGCVIEGFVSSLLLKNILSMVFTA